MPAPDPSPHCTDADLAGPALLGKQILSLSQRVTALERHLVELPAPPLHDAAAETLRKRLDAALAQLQATEKGCEELSHNLEAAAERIERLERRGTELPPA